MPRVANPGPGTTSTSAGVTISPSRATKTALIGALVGAPTCHSRRLLGEMLVTPRHEEDGDALSGDVTLTISPPLEHSWFAGILAVASLVGGAACLTYSVWT